jgi:hypothetical protein
LAQGQSWSNYEVAVTVVRDGKEIVRRQVINLNAGDAQKLTFDFDTETMVAAK